MKQITFLTLLVILLMSTLTNLSAQFGNTGNGETTEEEVGSGAVAPPYKLNVDCTRLFNDAFKSDGIILSGEFGLFNNISVNWTEGWEDALLSVGPTVSYSANSGIMNNQEFAESIQRIGGGVAAIVFFPASYGILKVEAGSHSTDYTLKSGYTEHRNKLYVGVKLGFHQYQGRLQDQFFFPMWNFDATIGFPWNVQQPVLLGYENFQARQNEAGTNMNAIHLINEIGLVDIAFSESLKLCLKVRGMAGKFNNDIIYFGGGVGFDIVVNNTPVFYINGDQNWGWKNSKFNNISINLGLSTAFLEQFWNETN